MVIAVGDKIPSYRLQQGSPGNNVDIAELVANKKAIIFGVPGAFTPGCHRSHLPGYVADYDKIVAKGVDIIICVSVNDAFVVDAWGKSVGAENKVVMLADPVAAFTKAIGMDLDATPILGNIRSKRYSMILSDGVLTNLNVEPDGTGLTCSLSNSILSQL
ncbi:Peroxiredoxin-5, mitochondrial [Trichoplax sp. H2]|uniref:Peroxiredoxin-5 n=1 Tax=Trichoplax adhaerens TaxID=10228 RepID=B3RLY4_TRIAD|nr:hypothetical protein TRIADDRAFT_49711 [Trichoplax adhaerens]EDV28867.1 hypothetical protein TRIADDRAFT_49711 [Trichoplax adhaerens]RDD46638.1 Peroxiredoxin-5, mitochondrial [Trichoplax sp. H2]|eukprot:XP_002108069.1 hypothetical protein TRIADDRAFT_49711 [Trichoplax adhaerens]